MAKTYYRHEICSQIAELWYTLLDNFNNNEFFSAFWKNTKNQIQKIIKIEKKKLWSSFF
jgi:hypothetical protein